MGYDAMIQIKSTLIYRRFTELNLFNLIIRVTKRYELRLLLLEESKKV